MNATWTKTDSWSQYETTLSDGTEITVSKYFPGEMWWVDQNFYWAWQIDTADGNQFSPGGEYERTMADCKRYALKAAARIVR